MGWPATGATCSMRYHIVWFLQILVLAGCAGQSQQASVSGSSKVPNEGATLCSQTGMASWYRGSSKNRASSQDNLVAAHRTLPIGTYVRVTAIESGKSIVVRINDRGPFGRGRVIDISRAAANQLGMLRDGVARVRLDPAADNNDCPFQQAQSD